MLKIRSLELKNFIQYSGTQKLDFSFNENRPLNVIFGENGDGKSGIIKSIRWVLFGKTRDDAFDEDRNYLNLLNRQAFKDGDYEIKVKLLLQKDSDEYVITRTKNLKKGISQFSSDKDVGDDDCQITRNGELIPKNNQNYIINSLMTEEMAIFNFIQGEEIFRYYDIGHMNIKKCIEAILKLPELDKASKILKSINGELRSKLTRTGFSNTQLQTLNEEIQKKEQLENQLIVLEDAISKYNQTIDDFSEKYNKKEETFEKQKELIKKLKESREKETDIIFNLKQSTPNLWKEIIKNDVDKFLQKYPPELQLQNKDLIYLLDESIKNNKCLICEQDIQKIKNILIDKKDRNSDLNSAKRDYSITLKEKFSQRSFDFNLYEENIKNLEMINFDNLMDEQDIDDLTQQIGSTEKYDQAKKQSDIALTLKVKSEKEKEDKTKEIKILEERIKNLNDLVNNQNFDKSELEKQVDLVECYKNCYDQIKIKLIEETKKKIEDEANIIYSKLLDPDQKYYLKINDQFKLEMYEKNFNDNDKSFEPSTGQKVIIMYSLIYAFRKAANFEGVLFIDNIFPNLSDHAKNETLKIIPDLFKHIILVQLKETRELNDKIIEKSDKVYYLKRDTARSSSIGLG
ncbi:MAG: hypothetical protein CBB97_25650 [Candidatus Endolissoclinum sp. TMED37]|nr:MAG: hypothetical protein CBB97_25650 [Candidatus Endolissoclinum sp. TMED37]|tara:strand:- start:2401 stop:4287 length:1887 start_codon:yes stop_codon:yes gene_type:complete